MAQPDDLPATPPRNLRRRPWWAGRVEVRELYELEAGNPAARPTWPGPGRVGGIIGGPAQRRRQKLPAPPRRERPADLEATAQGAALYGPRRAVPSPWQLQGPAAAAPTDTTGTKLAYRPLEGRAALVRGIRVRLDNAAAAEVEVQLLRAGNALVLYAPAAGAYLEVATPLILQAGDELRVELVTAAAGGTLTAAIAVEEWT